MLPANRTAGVLLLLGLATAACQDLPTAQRSQDDPAALNRGGSAAAPAGAPQKGGYTCLISKRTPAGPQQYHYMRVRGIQLPQNVEEKGGKKTLLQLTFQSPGEPVFARVNCRVPATQAAVDLMLGIFVRQAPQAALSPAKAPSAFGRADVSLFIDPKRRGRLLPGAEGLTPTGGPLMDTGCVTAGYCALPGITGYAYPTPTYTDPWGSMCAWGCGWNASAGDYGGGDYYDPGSAEEGATLAGDMDTIPPVEPNCNAPHKGTEYARCHSFTPAPGTDLDIQTRGALNRIGRRGDVCAAIAAKGLELLDAGKLGYFFYSEAPDQYDESAGYGGQWGALLDLDYWYKYYNGRDSIGRTFDNGLVHEIEHAMGLQHVDENARYPTTPNAFACGG